MQLPDIPGKSLVGRTTKGARLLATAAAGAVAGTTGFVLKRLLDRGSGEAGDVAPIAAAPPVAEAPAPGPAPRADTVPKPKPAKPKAAKKPKPAKPKAAKAAKPKPRKPARPKDPHHALNNPVVDDPDLTEYPDPYDTREDPLDPASGDGLVLGEGPHPPNGARSTSEPHPAEDLEAGDRATPPARDNLDE